MGDYFQKLNTLYEQAMILASSTTRVSITEENKLYLEEIVKNSQNAKGVLTVLTTLLVYKTIHPEQDIRYHQSQLENGFSGRSIDTSDVTPFLKSVNFPAMSESGWLTRSLEQAEPYTLEFKGKITPISNKTAFLGIIHNFEVEGDDPETILLALFVLLIKQRDSFNISLIKPTNLSIATIIKYLQSHFEYAYRTPGQSRLPVLAIYAAYECMIDQVHRFDAKKIMPLESHNSADTQSGRIADIDIWSISDNTPFEGVEVKHKIQITPSLVETSFKKFQMHQTKRYYLLTTANMDKADWENINHKIHEISIIHGCQVIVNGVYDSLKYYMRLLDDPAQFVENYVELLEKDGTLKFEHKEMWNKIVQSQNNF
ncbi:DNA methyltransferase [Listeria booriae]|uniref:DNA methyltransferase n=1 Tax=Listeria booriae TaxID=1552123 RepID=UPI001623BE47|nr:DNA methyltransferase [Listeria booriae]